MIVLPKIDLDAFLGFNIGSSSSGKTDIEFKALLDEFFKIFCSTEDSQKIDNFCLQFEFLTIPFLQLFSNYPVIAEFQTDEDLKSKLISLVLNLKQSQGSKLLNLPVMTEKSLFSQLESLLDFHPDKQEKDFLELKVVLPKETESTEAKLKIVEKANEEFNFTQFISEMQKNSEKLSEKNSLDSKLLLREDKNLDFLNEFISVMDVKGGPIQSTEVKQAVIHRINEISDIIAKAVINSKNTVTVQLQPPELGRILIKITLDTSGVKTELKVENPQLKEALAVLIPEIRSNLQSSGIKVSEFLLDLMRQQTDYSQSYSNQGQKRYKNNQKFIEYFA